MNYLLRKKYFIFFKYLSIWLEFEFEIDCKNNHFQKIPYFLCGELRELLVATYKNPVLNIFNYISLPKLQIIITKRVMVINTRKQKGSSIISHLSVKI
jgi:hypothetical protein